VQFVEGGSRNEESKDFRLQSEDMKREEERRQWEEEALKEMEGL
jgi:hypothetical protein